MIPKAGMRITRRAGLAGSAYGMAPRIARPLFWGGGGPPDYDGIDLDPSNRRLRLRRPARLIS